MSDQAAKLSVPAWAVTFLRMAVPAVVAICVMYVKVSLIERDIRDHTTKLAEMKTVWDARGELIKSHSADLIRIDARSTLTDQSIKETLLRIESDLKDVKNDIKQLQIKPAKE